MTEDTTYTQADLEASIARLRALAPRAYLYAAVSEEPRGSWHNEYRGSAWMTSYHRLDGAGHDATPGEWMAGTWAASADEALQKAVAYNLEYIAQIEDHDDGEPPWPGHVRGT